MAERAAPAPVAWLVNQYPKVSHSFIRREIEAIEQAGQPVLRFALRGWDAEVPDQRDRAERERTTYLLQGGALALLGPLCRTALRRPRGFVRALREAWALASHGERLWRPLAWLAEACRLAEQLLAHRVSHLHAHFGTNGAAVALLAHHLTGVGYSFTVHGPEEFDRPERLQLGRKIHHARFVVAISSFGRSQLYRWAAAADWPKVQVVRCGLEAAFHQGHDMPVPDVAQVVCVGRLCEQKGQLLLVEAAARLHRQGRPVQLVLAGDGEMRAQIEARVQALGLHGHVHITGWVSSDEVRALLLASRALVLPSFAEGLPVVLMEALALQRPVLTTAIAGIPELVRHGEQGWLVPAGDVEALVQAWRELLDADAPTLRDMGRRGQAAVLQRHDATTEAQRLLALIHRHAAEQAPEGAVRPVRSAA